MIINNSLQVSKPEFNSLHKLDSKVKELTETQKKVILVAIYVLSFLALIFFPSTVVEKIAAAVCLIITGIFFSASKLFISFTTLFIYCFSILASNKANIKPF